MYRLGRAPLNTDLSRMQYNVTKGWADYLSEHTISNVYQCVSHTTLDVHAAFNKVDYLRRTADAGSPSNSTNLALKGVIVLKAMSGISSALGQDFDAETYDVSYSPDSTVRVVTLTLIHLFYLATSHDIIRRVAVSRAFIRWNKVFGRVGQRGLLIATVQLVRRQAARNKSNTAISEHCLQTRWLSGPPVL